jgi:N-dimethylarginine dimethylaminohydrolase
MRGSFVFWTKNVLMCQPTFFNIHYKINPWMDGPPLAQEEQAEAHDQWLHLHHTVIRCGGYVKYLEPVDGLPDLVFTANGGLVHENKVVLPRFANKERQKETKYFGDWFRNAGYEILDLQRAGDRFEGNGDAFIHNGTLYLGMGERTSANVAGRILDFFGLKKLVLCELIDTRFYHLDTCFCPLADNQILWYSKAFSETSKKAILSGNNVLINVIDSEALSFACNSVVLDRNVIMPKGCSETGKRLEGHGYKVEHVAMDQFMKAGGAAKCLTLKV